MQHYKCLPMGCVYPGLQPLTLLYCPKNSFDLFESHTLQTKNPEKDSWLLLPCTNIFNIFYFSILRYSIYRLSCSYPQSPSVPTVSALPCWGITSRRPCWRQTDGQVTKAWMRLFRSWWRRRLATGFTSPGKSSVHRWNHCDGLGVFVALFNHLKGY